MPEVNKFYITQSALKDFKEFSPKKWSELWFYKTRKKEFKKATVMGSYLDALCFTPEDIENKFYSEDINYPSDNIRKIVEEVYEHIVTQNRKAKFLNEKPDSKVKIPYKKITLDDSAFIASLCKKNDYFASKTATGVTNVQKSSFYVDFLKRAKGRTIVTEKEKVQAQELKDILFNDPLCKGFFVPKSYCSVLFQQKITYELEVAGFENIQILPLKGLLDIIHINHKRKQIREVDLKCLASAYDFRRAVKMFNYVMQHSFYFFLLQAWKDTYEGGKYKDYEICSPLNVVIDLEDKTPYVYQFSYDDMIVERDGIENTYIKGWMGAVLDIGWHIDKQDWKRPKEHIINGKIFFNWYKK